MEGKTQELKSTLAGQRFETVDEHELLLDEAKGNAESFAIITDGREWHMARLYRNDYPEKLLLGLSSQSPKVNGHTCYFTEVSLIDNATTDFRNGKLEEE